MEGNDFGNYWRNELGTEFRNKALEYMGNYVEKLGEVNVNDDGKHYEAVLDIIELKDTIFPLGLSCHMTSMETRLVSKIVVNGRIGKGKLNNGEHIIEKVTIFDIQNNEIKNNDICIDSILFMLDFLDDKK